jgi:hypothetical protein
VTGAEHEDLPPGSGDRVHHDPRRTDQAVAAFALADDDLVVGPGRPIPTGRE